MTTRNSVNGPQAKDLLVELANMKRTLLCRVINEDVVNYVRTLFVYRLIKNKKLHFGPTKAIFVLGIQKRSHSIHITTYQEEFVENCENGL